jgi:chloramphenicol-sensitive protein RarD
MTTAINPHSTAQGVSLSLSASLLFATMYYYTSWLEPLDGEQIFAWRMLLTVPILALFIIIWGEWRQVRLLAERLKHEPLLWIALPCSSALIGVQLWLFLWAPLNGRALEVSLGYFMLPLSILLIGRLVYREKLSKLQNLAAVVAAIGVGHEFYQVGGFSWASLLVALGYPLYFIVRRAAGTNTIAGLWFDMLLTLPVALVFIAADGDLSAGLAHRPVLALLIPLLGLISATAVACYILASHRLQLGLFGLLGYVEPVLLVFVALLIGERIEADEWMTYVPIWIAVGLLTAEGLQGLSRNTGRRTNPRDG